MCLLPWQQGGAEEGEEEKPTAVSVDLVRAPQDVEEITPCEQIQDKFWPSHVLTAFLCILHKVKFMVINVSSGGRHACLESLHGQLLMQLLVTCKERTITSSPLEALPFLQNIIKAIIAETPANTTRMGHAIMISQRKSAFGAFTTRSRTPRPL